MNKNQDCCCHKEYPSRPLRMLFLVVGGLLAYALIGMDMSSLLQGTEINNNLRIIFLLGLVASISTCLAITGGVIVAYTDLTVSEHESNTTLWIHQFFLHSGRIVGFIILGGILGLLGQQISYTLGFTAWLNGIVGVFLLFLGLHILGLLPSWNIDVGVVQKLQHLGAKRGKKHWVTAIFGSLTFFIPCGCENSVLL